MEHEDGQWIMRGLPWDSPYRIRTWQELINWINEIGFLPFFANEVEGFSAEEHVSPEATWGYEEVTAAYNEKPGESWRHLVDHIKDMYPQADEKAVIRLIGKEP